MELRTDLRGLVRRQADGPSAGLSGDSLVIDCRECPLMPIPASTECLRCMVGCMCREGGADRVVLRTGRDTEISGRAGRAIKEAASLRRWSLPQGRPAGRCRGCPVSRAEAMSRAWDRFPEGDAGGMAAELLAQVPDREGCAECVEATVRALQQMDAGIERIVADMSGRPS